MWERDSTQISILGCFGIEVERPYELLDSKVQHCKNGAVSLSNDMLQGKIRCVFAKLNGFPGSSNIIGENMSYITQFESFTRRGCFLLLRR